MTTPADSRPNLDRIRQEIADGYDEELELELEEARLDRILGDAPELEERDTIDRKIYFRELFRLQHELVELQDWIQHQKLRVVVLF